MSNVRRQHPNAPLTPEGRRRMVACVIDQHWSIEATADRRYQRDRPGELIHVDVKKIWAVRAGAIKGTSHVVFELFDDVGRVASQAVAQRAALLEAWLDGTVVTPRFPTPIDRSLRS